MSLVDSASIPDGTVLHADVCIVGAGAAGIALATELDGTGLTTVVLESGGPSFEPEAHALTDFDSSGDPVRAAEPVRQRQVGGTTNTWYGRLGLLDAIDFEEREWVPFSGWPIPPETVWEYAPRAADFFGLRRVEAFQPELWAGDVTFRALEADGLRAGVHLWAPRLRTGRLHLPRLRRSEKVRVVCHAQVTRLVAPEDGEPVGSVDVSGFGGNRFSARAHTHVLACGGLENPRVLLLSRDRAGRGLGNRHDTVGRYYMNHPRGEDVARLHLDGSMFDTSRSTAIGVRVDACSSSFAPMPSYSAGSGSSTAARSSIRWVRDGRAASARRWGRGAARRLRSAYGWPGDRFPSTTWS